MEQENTFFFLHQAVHLVHMYTQASGLVIIPLDGHCGRSPVWPNKLSQDFFCSTITGSVSRESFEN
jgi:hypothetical protein